MPFSNKFPKIAASYSYNLKRRHDKASARLHFINHAGSPRLQVSVAKLNLFAISTPKLTKIEIACQFESNIGATCSTRPVTNGFLVYFKTTTMVMGGTCLCLDCASSNEGSIKWLPLGTTSYWMQCSRVCRFKVFPVAELSSSQTSSLALRFNVDSSKKRKRASESCKIEVH